MRGLRKWLAIGALATACGCASFKPRSALQNDSSGRPPSPTTAVRTARFAGEGGPATAPILNAAPPTGGYVAVPAPATQPAPAPVAQPAAPKVPAQPSTPMAASIPPTTAPPNTAVVPMTSPPIAASATWSYPQTSAAPWVGPATSAYRVNGPTGSSFSPYSTSYGGVAASGMVSGTAGLPAGAPSALLTPSSPLAQRTAGLRLHPNPQPGSAGNAENAAMPTSNASPLRSPGGAPFALPAGGRDGFNPPSSPASEFNPSTSRRDAQPQLSPGRPPALDGDGLGGSRKESPPFEPPGSGGSADALKRAFTPSAGELSPPAERKSAAGDPFEPPVRPTEKSSPPFKPLPPPTGASQGVSSGTLQPPPPVNPPRGGELSPPGSR